MAEAGVIDLGRVDTESRPLPLLTNLSVMANQFSIMKT